MSAQNFDTTLPQTLHGEPVPHCDMPFRLLELPTELQLIVLEQYALDYGHQVEIRSASLTTEARKVCPPLAAANKHLYNLYQGIMATLKKHGVELLYHFWLLHPQRLRVSVITSLLIQMLTLDEVKDCTISFRLDFHPWTDTASHGGLQLLAQAFANLENLRVDVHTPLNTPPYELWLKIHTQLEHKIFHCSRYRNDIRWFNSLVSTPAIVAAPTPFTNLNKVIVCVRANADTELDNIGKLYLMHRYKTVEVERRVMRGCNVEVRHKTQEAGSQETYERTSLSEKVIPPQLSLESLEAEANRAGWNIAELDQDPRFVW